MNLQDRFAGCLLGLACGDAVGTTVEFSPRGTFAPVTDMIGGGPFDLQPGQWTDDTSMALCLAHSLLTTDGFDPGDQMRRYVDWMQNGTLSSTGFCFDIGNTVSAALHRFIESGEPFSGSTAPRSAGNGSIMRLAPVPMYFHADRAQVLFYSGESSRTTHGSAECVDACRLLGAILHVGLGGGDKTAMMMGHDYRPKTPRLAALVGGTYQNKEREQIRGTGYVVDSLEAALWCFWHTDSFADAVLTAVNLGDDADTTGAIVGQIAGACYGKSAIPATWLHRLTAGDAIEQLAIRLLQAANTM